MNVSCFWALVVVVGVGACTAPPVEPSPRADAVARDGGQRRSDATSPTDLADAAVPTPADGATLPTGFCGQSGSLESRIASCATKRCVAKTPTPTIVPCTAAHDVEWDAVAQVSNSGWVWRDSATKMVWGDDRNVASDQPKAIAACQATSPSEASLAGAIRLPTIAELETAAADGIRVVAAYFDDLMWWSSTRSAGKALAYEEGRVLSIEAAAFDEYYRFRCVIPDGP